MGVKLLTIYFAIASLASVLNGQTQTGPKHGKVVMCYLATWSIYHEGAGKFKVSDIDTSLCTHVIYSFAGLDESTNKIKSLDPGLDNGGKFENEGYVGFVNLKRNNPHLKTLISIGGWNEGSLKFSNMVATPENRATFIQSVLEFLDTYKFDGIDMHWKHPTLRDGRPQDKANYILLMKEFKEAFAPHGYILATVMAELRHSIDSAYDLPELNKYVDYVNVLAYDYHGTWDGVLGVNAPLNGLHKDDYFSVESTIQHLLANGISPSKMILGLPLTGRTYFLENPEVEELEIGRTPAKSEGFMSPYSKEKGFIAYNEVCLELTKNDDKWTRYWHEQSSTPYLRNGDKYITYENTRSLAIKVKKAMEYNLGGVLVWTIDSDDFNGMCDKEPDYVSVSFSALHRFVQKFNRITRNPILQRLLKELDLPDDGHILVYP